MRFSRSAVVATILASAEAFTIPVGKSVQVQNKADINYPWAVTNWKASCAKAGCYYEFNVSAAAYETSGPAFSAYCNGGIEGAPFRDCTLVDNSTSARQVAARLETVNSTGDGAHLVVSYQFADLTTQGTYWNYTAYATTQYNQVGSEPLNFTMTPSEVWAAA